MDSNLRKQLEDINQQAFTIAGIQMQTTFNKQKTALNELNTVVGMLFVTYVSNGYVVVNKTQKAILLKQITDKVKKIFSDLSKTEINNLSEALTDAYAKVFENETKLLSGNTYPIENINKTVNTPIAGELFTTRINDNNNKVKSFADRVAKDILNSNSTLEDAIKNIKRILSIATYDYKRVGDSELTRILAEASTQVCKELNIKRQIWSAAFENSCSKCIKLDGKPFKVGKAPKLPLHANCHCLLIPYIE